MLRGGFSPVVSQANYSFSISCTFTYTFCITLGSPYPLFNLSLTEAVLILCHDVHWQTLTLESDHFLCVRERVNEQNQLGGDNRPLRRQQCNASSNKRRQHNYASDTGLSHLNYVRSGLFNRSREQKVVALRSEISRVVSQMVYSFRFIHSWPDAPNFQHRNETKSQVSCQQ